MKQQSRFRDWQRPYGDRAPLVREPRDGDRVLAVAENNPKLGGDIERRGREPSRVVYLEEYSTCPDSCRFKRYGDCLGENTRADRYIVTPKFWEHADREANLLHLNHARWFLRLHGLGDFFSVDYVRRWIDLAERYPSMHIWGFTHRVPDSDIGYAIKDAMARFPKRWRTHWSDCVAERGTAVCFDWHTLSLTDGIVDPVQYRDGIAYPICPEQLDRYVRRKPSAEIRTCADCRRCIVTETNVGFLFHGPQFYQWRRRRSFEN